MAQEQRPGSPGMRTLPEFHETPDELEGDRDAFYRYRDAVSRKEGLSIEAVLPQIIGYVPPEERAFFSTYPQIGEPADFYGRFAAGTDGFNALVAGMPGVYDLITKDIARWKIPGLALEEYVVDRRITRAGADIGLDNTFHVDSLDPFYIVVDNNGPEFYAGPAQIQKPRKEVMLLDPKSLDPSVLPVRVPDFAIVRMNPHIVHRKRVFEKDARRTRFMAYTARKK